MPISYRIHANLGLLVTRYVEVVTDDEFIETYQSILDDPGFRHGFNEIADLQELQKFAVTANAFKHVSALVTKFYKGHGRVRVGPFRPPLVGPDTSRVLAAVQPLCW